MTREEFIAEARRLGYAEKEINEILGGVDEITSFAPDCFEFDYSTLPLFEQPDGDI